MSESTPLDYQSPEPSQGEPAGPPKGALGTIFLIVFMDLLGFGIIIPLLPFYVKTPQDHPFKVTLLFSLYSICQFIGAPILGALSDRIGRRPVLAFSQLGSVIGYLLLGVATQFHWRHPGTMIALVYVSRIIDGFSGGNISTAQAYISDVTTRENRAKGMGLIGAAFGIGFSVGPFLGGVLGSVHVSIPAYFAAAFSAVAAILTLIKLKESRVHKPTEAEAWLHPSRFLPVLRRPVLVQLLAISFFLMAAFVMMESTVGLFLNGNRFFHWGAREVGWYFAFIGVIIAIVQGGLIGKLTKRFGDWPLSITGPLLVATGMIGYFGVEHWPAAFAPALGLLMLTGALNAIGRSIQGPTSSSLISKFSDPRDQGVVFGLYHGLSSLARVIGPIVAGATYPLMRHTGQFITAGVIAAAMGLWTLALRQPAPHEPEPSAARESAIESA
ncbi:MAG TPA: MFS transporter [Tepidisphaeraceae bacterium]|jgi:DHA1 family tetracycline resistance protein-like MFS transporter|nr:MFS transporter [Tepidisphaeraceae bacterium]